jgi:triphosphoribosyl-dephospho-CoA synthase
MTAGVAPAGLADAFVASCMAELQALKPGNVHVHAAGHGMEVRHFEESARAAAPHIAESGASVGRRILEATRASFAAAGVNTNLGIILLTTPIAKAIEKTHAPCGLRNSLRTVLATLDRADAADAFAAIRLANPGGLGRAESQDVAAPPTVTLREAMALAADRDRIARAYVTDYADVFDFALPVLRAARECSKTPNLSVTTLHMALLAEFPDTHIVRKHGAEVAEEIRAEAISLRPMWSPVPSSAAFASLMEFDSRLKARGINPGTTADFVVATLFMENAQTLISMDRNA